MDYQANSRKSQEGKSRPEKKVEKVVTGEVVVKKKSIGRKFRDLFIEADFRSVARYVVAEVLLPAARNTIVDASTKGIERMMYGETAIRRRNYGIGPRITYNSPIRRDYRDSREPIPLRQALDESIRRTSRRNREDFILSSREEAEQVLEQMNEIIDTYDFVSVADLNEMVGYPSTHVDNKWGWVFIGDAQVRQIREGYLIDLPAPEPNS